MLNAKRKVWQRFLSVFLVFVLTFSTVSTTWIDGSAAETGAADSQYAAQIGDTGYETLQAAIDAAAGAGEEHVVILLQKNVAENITSAGVDYTLDMQGYTVSTPEGSTNRVYTINGGSVTLKNGTITGGNTASDTGAGLAVLSGAVLTAENLVITQNVQTGGVGGGMYIEASVVTMVSCTVSDNTSLSDGGGIEMKSGASLTADHLVVRGNQTVKTGTWGGGICAEGSSAAQCTLELKNSDIVENSAVGSGGGIYMTYTTFSATDTHIDHNAAGSNGGGIATSSTTSSKNPGITFEGACTVSGNTAGTTSTTTSGGGSGLYVWTNNFYADGLVINGNTTMLSKDDVAAGMYLRASTPSSNPGNVVLKNVEISDNVNMGDKGTGGLYVNMGTATQHYASFQMTDCRILQNQGGTYGGAYLRVHSNDGQSTELVNCEFRDNASGDTLFLFGSSGRAGIGTRYTLSNCRIENNNAYAAGKAGGINAGSIEEEEDFWSDEIITSVEAVEKLTLINTVVTGNSGSATGGILGWPCFGEDSAVYGNMATDGSGANDLKIPYLADDSASITVMNGALSAPAASAMTDGEQSFAEYVWKDYNGNGYKLEGEITKDTLEAAIGADGMASEYFCFTAGPDITRYVAEITDASGEKEKFESVKDAVAAVQNGDTIRLTAGEEDNSGTMISENVQIPAGANITIDMNGRTLMSLTGQAIEVAESASLTLVGTEGSAVETRYDEAYAIINKGTLVIADSEVKLSGVDNRGGSLTLSDGVQITTINCQKGDVTLSENVHVTALNNQEGNLTLSENVQITALNNQEGSLVLSDNDQIGTLNNLAGNLSLSKDVQIGTISHQGGSLTLSGNAQADTVSHQGDSFEISGNAAVANINLAAGKYVIADGSFDPETITFTLASTELKALNTWGEKTVTLIAPTAGAALAEDLAEKITLTGINALVVIERDAEGKVIAKTQELDGVFVDGIKGDDKNPGTHDEPVKTFERAKEILTEKCANNETVDGIYVINTITIKDNEEWSMGTELNAAGMKLIREPSFTGALVSVANGAKLTLADITIDGMGKEGTVAGNALIQVNAGAELDICAGAVLTNNYRTRGYGGAIYSNGTVMMTGGEVSGSHSEFGGGIGLSGKSASMTISGGNIAGNIAEIAGGGIGVLEDAKLTLTGNGTISGNSAHTGGGISVGGTTTVTLGTGNGKLIMSGGVIEGNVSKAEGGGIYIQCRNSAEITAGEIINNTSKGGAFGGGGIYVNGTRNVDGTNYQYGELYLTNALIADNNAKIYGGGIAGCSTSTVNVYQKNGAYVIGNTASDGTHQIFVSDTLATLGIPDYFISEYMPDGTPYLWNYKGLPVASDSLHDKHSTIILDSSASSENASAAFVRITGNSAMNNGGGIGTNGFVQIGEPDEPDETVDISVTKVWDDAANKDGFRPDSVKIWLMRSTDGETYERVSFLTFSDQTGDPRTETLSFVQQPKKDAGGKEYIYTVEEELPEKADGSTYPYVSVISETAENGFVVTNQQVIDISGSKTWVDNDNQDGVRPESITINLLADGKETAEKTVTAEDNWSWSFTDLPKFKNGGEEITYTITEDPVEGYTSEVKGYNVTNTHTPEKITVSGSKTWNDHDDQDGVRPESITINLLADGKETAEKTVTAEDNWSWSFTDLPKFKNGGEEITYTITEDPVKGYTSEVKGYNVTNTHIPEEPTTPEEPTIPEEPTTPEEPTMPEEPTIPEKPTTPEEPTMPEEPTIPEEPTMPEEPTIPAEPTTPEEPIMPEKPTMPEEMSTEMIERGELVIVVLDEVTKEPVPDAHIRITDSDGIHNDYITNKQGKVFGDFVVGQYKVEVLEVPDGYNVTIGKEITVTVEANQTVERIAAVENEGQLGEDGTGHLPITGMLVWPISVLSIMGVLLMTIGILDNRRRKHL